MGLFLAISGVMNASVDAVHQALAAYAASEGGGFELTEGTTETPNIGIISCFGPHCSILYPDGFCEWDEASKFISKYLGKTVFSFHIHDEDIWMYILYNDGAEIDHFNPMPDYWDEVPENEMGKWRGNPFVIAKLVPGISAEMVANYLVEWDLPEEGSEPHKAYPEDEFFQGDCWQLCDFMKKLGLDYPIGADGSIHGETFRLWTNDFHLLA